MKINDSFLTINHLLTQWCCYGKDFTLSSWIFKVLPSYILWNIWKARNKVKFDSITMCHSIIIDDIRAQINSLYHANTLKLKRRNTTLEAINFFNLSILEKDSYLLVILWQRPLLFGTKSIPMGLAKATQD